MPGRDGDCVLCDPFYRFYLEARGSGDYIRSWNSSGSKFTQALWLENCNARSQESGDRWRKSGGTDWRGTETNYQNQIPGNYKPTVITNHCYISAARKPEALVGRKQRNQTGKKRCDMTKIVSLFRSNDALGTSQLFEDATKIKVHGIIWQMAGFRVAGVTLVPLCVKLEIQHSQPIGIILKPNTDFSLSCPVSCQYFHIFTFLWRSQPRKDTSKLEAKANVHISHDSTKWFGSQWKSEIIILQIDKITRLSLPGINCVFC